MARGGMRISEVLKLTPADINDRRLTLREPKSGKEQEFIFIPQKIAELLKDYIKDKGVQPHERIFPIGYEAAREMVANAGKVVGIHLRPHDLRRHAATYASRSGCPSKLSPKSYCGMPIWRPPKDTSAKSVIPRQCGGSIIFTLRRLYSLVKFEHGRSPCLGRL